jgi:hypothetical protein
MNDYAHGPLEALAWTLNLLEDTEDLCIGHAGLPINLVRPLGVT